MRRVLTALAMVLLLVLIGCDDGGQFNPEDDSLIDIEVVRNQSSNGNASFFIAVTGYEVVYELRELLVECPCYFGYMGLGYPSQAPAAGIQSQSLTFSLPDGASYWIKIRGEANHYLRNAPSQ